MNCYAPTEEEAQKEKQEILNEGNTSFVGGRVLTGNQLESLLKQHENNGGLVFVMHGIRVLHAMHYFEILENIPMVFKTARDELSKDIQKQPNVVKRLALGIRLLSTK